VAKVAAIEDVCARHGVPLRAAALQFAAAHPAATAVLAGARTVAEVDGLVAMRRYAVPPGFWVELRDRALVADTAPLPTP
jgi:D-threo-aldose 1-dehydrogenase